MECMGFQIRDGRLERSKTTAFVDAEAIRSSGLTARRFGPLLLIISAGFLIPVLQSPPPLANLFLP